MFRRAPRTCHTMELFALEVWWATQFQHFQAYRNMCCERERSHTVATMQSPAKKKFVENFKECQSFKVHIHAGKVRAIGVCCVNQVNYRQWKCKKFQTVDGNDEKECERKNKDIISAWHIRERSKRQIDTHTYTHRDSLAEIKWITEHRRWNPRKWRDRSKAKAKVTWNERNKHKS